MNRQKHKLSRRILAVLLMAAMLITMLPSAMFAAPGGGNSGQETIFTDKEAAIEATGVTAKKELKDNGDGTYTIDLSVEGFTNTSTETKNLPADIVLVVDTSTSMADKVECGNTSFYEQEKDSWPFRYTVYVCSVCGAEYRNPQDSCSAKTGPDTRLDVAKSAAKSFVEGLFDASSDVKIGLYDFSGSNRTNVPLTDNKAALLEKIEGLYMPRRGDGTDYGKGLGGAQNILNASTDDSRQKFVVFLSDGEPQSGNNGVRQANQLKDAGVTIFSVGIDTGDQGNAANALRAIASSDKEENKYFYAATSDGNSGAALTDILAQISQTIQTTINAGTNAVMTDVINTDVFEVVESPSGKGVDVHDNTITWNIGNITSEKKSISFTVKPQDGHYGTLYTNQDVNLTFYSSELKQDVKFEKEAIGHPFITIQAPMQEYTINYYIEGTIAPVPGIDPNPVTGEKKVGETISINYPVVTGYAVCDDQPTSLEITNGSNTVNVYYKVDEGQTKNLEATVDYKLGDEVQTADHKDLTATVQVLEPDTLSTEGVEAKKYEGWKLDRITINDKEVESLPETVNNGDKIVYHYVVDEEAIKNLKATVDYKLGDEVQTADHKDLTATVQVLEPDTLSTEGVEAKKYEGWKLDRITINDKEVESLPETVNNGDKIVYHYVAATYDLIYNANDGKYPVNGTEIATVPGLEPGQYDIWTKGAEDDKIVGTMPKEEFLPTHDSVGEDKVVFVGWSEAVDTKIYAQEDTLPETVLYLQGTKVTIADTDKTLYAVWGYDKNDNGTADVLEKLTLSYNENGGYGAVPIDRNSYKPGNVATLDKEVKPEHSPADDGTAVVFLGWGRNQIDEIYAAGEDYSAAGVTESVTFEDEDITVYAVWGYDENNDGVADATQVLITPADITAYTGGTPYGGIADINGNIITETVSGLPEPGYFITLPYDVQQWLNAQTGTTVGATNLHDYMTFTYKGTDGSGGTTTREWKLEYQGVYETDENGNALRYVYSLTPATVDGKEIPVRLNYFKDTNNNGKLDETETALTNDDITMSEDLAHDTFSMTINPGELDQSVIKAAFNANGDTKDSTVGIGTGTLTVKSVTDVDTTTNAIGNSESDVTENTLTAVANGSVTYYVNDSQVDVDNKTDRVQLLVDSVSNNDEFNAQMGQHAIETVEGSSDTHDYELAYMDLVDTANGNAEIKLGDNDKLTIYWPMPENADPNGDFQVVHYTDMNREGTVDDLDAVNTQTLKATQVTVNGMAYLTFEVSSFSPFALVYTADDGTDTPDYPDYPIWTPDGDDDGPSGLNTEDHFSYVVGYAEDYRTGEATDNEDLWPVKPNNQITRAEVATIFYRLLEDEVRDEYDTTTNDFSDVTADSWYNQTVSTLARMGIVKGYEDGSFRPNAPITRAEFGAIATRFFAETGATYEPGTFTDVTGNEWFANAIQDAVNLGLIGGYPDGTVRPNNNITRAEACAIVNRTLGRVPDADHLLPEDVMKVWPDNNPTDWFYADMQEATNGHEYAWIEEDGHEIEEWTNLLDKDWTDR